MNKQKLFLGLACLLVVVLLTGVAGAQVSTSYDLSFYVLDGSGGRSVDTHFVLDSEVGQPVVGFSDSAHFGLESGYSPLAPGSIYKVHLPLVLRNGS
jgi:hypothetical protein